MSNQTFKTFIVEVGVEEIPSRFVEALSAEFARMMEASLLEERLHYRTPRRAATPRRLIFQAAVAEQQTHEVEQVRGPAVSVAYREGVPTPALDGFLRRVNKRPEELSRAVVGGKEYLVAGVEKPTQSAREVLPEIVSRVLASLPQPRSMRWGSGDARFIRPVRWILALFDDEVLRVEALGVESGSVTYGNRTDHPEAIGIKDAREYWPALERVLVEADGEKRRTVIREVGDMLAAEAGGRVDWDEELLDEVANLVEWPTPFLGGFEEEFLEVPDPVLITSMKVHQRYFPLKQPNGHLLPAFLAVRNGRGEDLAEVRHGNEKVLRARLSDARYFYRLDQKTPLSEHEPGLAGVTLHAKLGTYADKVARLLQLFDETRTWWNVDQAGAEDVVRAIHLYKCDLLTQVVSEFPELQGEMGAIYAKQEGERPDVEAAIRDQYHPGFPGDRVPDRPVAAILGLLDRADTLVSFYGANLRATGSEDPFGLRRVALGLARIAAETPVLGDHTVTDLIATAAKVAEVDAAVVNQVLQLVTMRLMSEWENEWPTPWLQAVLARSFPWPQLGTRLAFIRDHQGTELFSAAAQAYKRLERIARDAGPTVLHDTYGGVEGDLKAAADQALTIAAEDLASWWGAVENLVPVVERFFEEVLVMDPDPMVRQGRLGLVKYVAEALGRYYAWDVL
ncbi:glycine--tRNA ligase subunit beta [Sulfobacillus harzensis]|uniref:Glycine--tRNA ligase beta subunit n=1 Tax=Sulfobacillus harzensis TaxID=2729629 RepID=A0A7Y0L482_9FIRM|nr:glycine--tRNA ligase subunit beta [Sulfobacillus harzensis]